jgi:3D (Asp-Asp-Asp) domain-containing protein
MGPFELGSMCATIWCLLAAPQENFRNTYYYSVQEADYASQAVDNVIYDLEGKVLAQVSTAFRKQLLIEGTGTLLDGRVVNYAGFIDKETRFHVTHHPYGHGVGDCPLDPFRTIAVDPNKIPLGSVVLIKETVGMLLPDGSVHDGLWKAEDIGGAIKSDRVDLFVGNGDQGHVLTKAGIRHLAPLDIQIRMEPSRPSCLDQVRI